MKSVIKMFHLIIPSPSFDLDKKSSTTMIEKLIYVISKWLFTFLVIPNQSNFRVLDSFKKIHVHLLQLNFKFRNATIVIELATWNIGVLISVLVSIVEIILILQTYDSCWKNVQERILTMGRSLPGNRHKQPRRYIRLIPKTSFSSNETYCSWDILFFSPCPW